MASLDALIRDELNSTLQIGCDARKETVSMGAIYRINTIIIYSAIPYLRQSKGNFGVTMTVLVTWNF